MPEFCKLYNIESPLRDSHIYPKFVIEYLKNSGSKYLRGFGNPNLRMQDGLKHKLLSEKAEQEFGKREKYFAENIFLNYMDEGQTVFQYDANLYYFSISFLWRILLLELAHPSIKPLPFYHLLEDVEIEWKNFLSSYAFPLKHLSINLLFTSRIADHNLNIDSVDYYFTRALDGCVIANKDHSYIAIYGKFLRFMFWHTVKSPNPVNYDQVSIHPTSGVIKSPQHFYDIELSSFFPNRINTFNSRLTTSQKQQQIILDELKKNHSAFFTSDAGQSIMNDISLSKKKKGSE